ncbi:MAG: zinc-ribbon domain-containing protein [Tannerellaceae bacterium]
MRIDNTLAEKHPKIAQEWDYNRNGGLTPKDVTAGSHANVYWICPICNQSYKKKICNRTAPSKVRNESAKCPVCLGRVIIPGFNSLKAKYPEIVRREWDYQKNSIDPDTIPPHRNKPKYWWKCKKGHSYDASVNNKTSQTGGNCPYCSHQKLTIENSLSECNPILASEWCETNNELSPEQVSVNSNQEAWWKCSKGHIWKAKINSRNSGKGCPQCSKGTQTSVPELIVYHYVSQLFADAINGYKFDGKEIDVYIPSLNIGIEYDGEHFHKTKSKYITDKHKTEYLISHGIEMIRIRESKCYPIDADVCTVYTFIHTYDYRYLVPILHKVINELCSRANIVNTVNIDIKSIRNELAASLYRIPYSDSFAAFLENNSDMLDSIWDTKRNNPLTPEMVKPYSDHYVYWICKKNPNHRRYAPIKSISRGYGCDWCAKRHKYSTEEWIEEAIAVHGDRYDYSLTDYINSKTVVSITCSIHGVFQQVPSEHLSGKGCKWCGGQGGFHDLNTLEYCYPELAKEWDYEHAGNKGLTPLNVVVTDSTNEYWWKCNHGKPHSYHATISYRMKRKSGCAVCHGKQITYETSLEFLRPDLVSEWHESNNLKPSEVTCGSEKKIYWKCKNRDHRPYKAMVYNRAHLKSGCPECSGNIKTPLVYKKELKEMFPYIELLTDYQASGKRIECRCSKCEYVWSPFPYNLLRGKGCPKCKGNNLL